MWPAIATITAAVLGIAGSVFGNRKPRLYKRMHRQVELLNTLPENSAARASVVGLLDITAEKLTELETARLSRTLNSSNLAAAIVVFLIGALITWGLWSASLALSGSGWAVVVLIIMFVVALISTIIVVAFVSILFKPTAPRKKKGTASGDLESDRTQTNSSR